MERGKESSACLELSLVSVPGLQDAGRLRVFLHLQLRRLLLLLLLVLGCASNACLLSRRVEAAGFKLVSRSD